ncbi:hypothetical protein GC167_00860 [bacterium]|nr:hypothetical protein [bacterium]
MFTDNEEWGMYVANDGFIMKEGEWEHPGPIRIIGFNQKSKAIFSDVFKFGQNEFWENLDYLDEKERPELEKWVPDLYKR